MFHAELWNIPMSYTLIKVHHLLVWLFGVHLRFMFSSNDFIVVYSFYVRVCSYRLPEQVATDITEYKAKYKSSISANIYLLNVKQLFRTK